MAITNDEMKSLLIPIIRLGEMHDEMLNTPVKEDSRERERHFCVHYKCETDNSI